MRGRGCEYGSTKFAFTPIPTRGFNDRAEVRGKEIIFPRELQGKNGVFSELEGTKNDVKDYDFRIENLKTRAGVHITSDQPLERVNFWAISTAASAEPYIHLRIDPGKQSQWTIRYDFYTLPFAQKQ